MSECEIIRYDRKTKNEKIKIEGLARVHDVLFKFSLNEQNKIMTEMRGTISARDEAGNVSVRKRVENGSKIEKKISSAIICSSFADVDIKARILEKAKQLFYDNIGKFESDTGLIIRPDKITLIRAVDRYGLRYISEKHGNASEESKKNYLRMMVNAAVALPHKPMSAMSTAEVNRAIVENNISDRARNELSNFCDYCLMKMFVTGDNPVIKRHKKKRSRTVAKKKASKIDTLSELQEDKMYVILSKRINGASCAVALMASGFHPREIEGLTWEDVIIYGRDYVVVKLYKSDYASATHNYSRPVVPQAAEILFKYKQMLVESYGKKADTFPIAGMSRDPAKQMDSNRIVREAKDILVGNFLNNDEYVLLSEADAEMAAATKVLHNTYRRDLELRCQLINDQGRLKFLLGESLANDVTADAYTAFTSPEGERANYGILKCLRRKEMVTRKEACTSETVTSKSIVPAYTTEFARGYAAIRLKPGERIHIYSEYGHELRILSKKEGE